MAARQPHKFIGFFKLIEAMKRPGCPVCGRLADETHHAMESFLYESVNDPGLRNNIRADRGLCPRHSWQLADFGDALGGAILFGDILESLLPSIDAVPSVKSRRQDDAKDRPCLFCRREHQTLEGVFSELADHWEDAELQAAWQGPAVLCMAHLKQLCQRVRQREHRRMLVEMHRRRYENLCGEMKTLIGKQSYEHHPAEIGPEKDSWLRAVEVLAGKKELS